MTVDVESRVATGVVTTARVEDDEDVTGLSNVFRSELLDELSPDALVMSAVPVPVTVRLAVSHANEHNLHRGSHGQSRGVCAHGNNDSITVLILSIVQGTEVLRTTYGRTTVAS
jgi:hypothetical protein